jgi:hypothetical protein
MDKVESLDLTTTENSFKIQNSKNVLNSIIEDALASAPASLPRIFGEICTLWIRTAPQQLSLGLDINEETHVAEFNDCMTLRLGRWLRIQAGDLIIAVLQDCVNEYLTHRGITPPEE